MAPDDEDDETERLLNALKQQWQQTQARGDDAKLPELQEMYDNFDRHRANPKQIDRASC